MDLHFVLIEIVIILFSARIMGEIASYFNIPTVIGELLAGIIIGPSLFGWIEINPGIQLLAEIGIILLLFEVGLETDIKRLSTAGLQASAVAVIGVVLPFLFGFFLSYSLFAMPLLASLFVGCTFTATSIGITLRVLHDLKQQNTEEAQIIIGAAVLDDIIGIVLLSFLYEFSKTGSLNFLDAGKTVLMISFFFILAPILAKVCSFVIKRWADKSTIPGLIPTMFISVILLFAWLAQSLGAPELLGGFTAGLALSRQFFLPFAVFLNHSKEFVNHVEEQMLPLVHLFVPIFFVAIGLSLNLKAINWASSSIWILTASLLTVAVVGKLLSGFILFRYPILSQLMIGVSMIPRGEVGLIFANQGLLAGVLKDDIYASIILVITFTTLLAPFGLRWVSTRKRLALNVHDNKSSL